MTCGENIRALISICECCPSFLIRRIFQLCFFKSDFCNRNNLTFNACLNHMYEVR